MRQRSRRTASLLNLPEASLEQLAHRIAARHVPLSAIQSVSVLIAALAAGTAQAATYIVDTTEDGPVGQVEGCSLREAITSLSALTPQDFGGCTHTGAFGVADTVDLSALSGTIRLDRDEGAIGIAVPLTITGPALASNGKPALTIKGNKGKQPSRIFGIFLNSATSISNLKLTGGQTAANNQPGGAIQSDSDLTLTNCVVTGNSTLGVSGNGGGLFVFGHLTLNGSTVSKNRTLGENSEGGGFSSTTATLTNSTVSGNRTEEDSSDGGGLIVYGDITLTDTTVSGNQTKGISSEGGGLLISGNATLINSTVSGNRTKEDDSDGGGLFVYGNATLTNSTVSGNSTKGNTGPGGGLFVAGNATLTNSTVSGNSTRGDYSTGGGLYVHGDLALNNSTIAFNRAQSGTDGIYTPVAFTFTVNNSIIAQSGTDEAACNAPIEAGANNLIASADGSDNSCGPALTTLNALGLQNLDDNGGDTETHALREGSVALDAGNNGTCESTDQRGVARPQDGTCDIGSFELEPGS